MFFGKDDKILIIFLKALRNVDSHAVNDRFDAVGDVNHRVSHTRTMVHQGLGPRRHFPLWSEINRD